jgi:hypothetical protein
VPAFAGLLFQLDTARYKMGPGERLTGLAELTTKRLKKAVQSFSLWPSTADSVSIGSPTGENHYAYESDKLLIRDQARGPNRLVRGVNALGFFGMLLVVSERIKLLSNKTRFVSGDHHLSPTRRN